MLGKIVSNAWIVFVFLAGFEIYESWEKHEEERASLEGQIPASEAKIQRAKKKKREIGKYLKDIDDAKRQINLVAEEVEKVSRQLPNVIDDAENLGHLKKIAEDLNIKGIFLSPLNEENRGFFVAKRYEVTGSGTFLQYLIFMEKLGASDKLLNVKNVEFTRSKKRQRGRYQVVNAKIIVEAYRYNSNYREDRGIESIERQFKEKNEKKPAKKEEKRRRRRRRS